MEEKKNLQQNNRLVQMHNQSEMDNSEDGAEKLEDKAGEESGRPPIYLVEVLLLLPLVLISDLIDTLELTGVGYFIALPVDLICIAIVTLWLKWKRRKLRTNLIASIIDLIPFLGILPIKTISFLIIVIKDRLPQGVKKTIDKVENVANKAQGKIKEAEVLA